MSATQAPSMLFGVQVRPYQAWSLCLIVVFLLWVGAFHAARLLEYAPLTSLWFPPAAVSFAAFMVLRWRALIALILANLTGTLSTFGRVDPSADFQEILVGGLLFGTAHLLAYWVGAELILRTISSKAPASMSRIVTTFLFAGMVAAGIAAVGGTVVTAITGLLRWHDAKPLILPWFIGDYTGLIVLGPLIAAALYRLTLSTGIRFDDRLRVFDDLPRPERDLRAFLFKLTTVLVMVVVSLLAIAQAPDNEPLMFIMFVAVVPQLWIVHTHGLLESLISLALFGFTIVIATYTLGLGDVALTQQFAMITLAASSYYGLSVPMLYADNTKLRKLLTHDVLTSAYTRHFFVELSKQAIRQNILDGRPASMLMLDLDNLKLINDRHGHAAGDRALSHVVKSFRGMLGENDLLGRLGGDEFGVLLPGRTHLEAIVVAERLLEAVRGTEFFLGDEIKPSISIGIATTDDAIFDYDSLWMRADAALYIAKRGGRDRYADLQSLQAA